MEGQGREMMQGGSVEEYNGVARARERERGETGSGGGGRNQSPIDV